MPDQFERRFDLSDAEQAAVDSTASCIEKHPDLTKVVLGYPEQKGRNGAIDWPDYCYVPATRLLCFGR